ncbi:MAG: hypothetical protein ACI388_03565 [Methanobrevibacter sp.]|uniref:hypothetical protein n=1 Tax=Methanobrevibacter sp. TaxID=66852 RepID=UPI003F063115
MKIKLMILFKSSKDKRKIKKLNKKLKKANKLNEELLNSRSWKVTKPLRKIKNRNRK